MYTICILANAMNLVLVDIQHRLCAMGLRAKSGFHILLCCCTSADSWSCIACCNIDWQRFSDYCYWNHTWWQQPGQVTCLRETISDTLVPTGLLPLWNLRKEKKRVRLLASASWEAQCNTGLPRLWNLTMRSCRKHSLSLTVVTVG